MSVWLTGHCACGETFGVDVGYDPPDRSIGWTGRLEIEHLTLDPCESCGADLTPALEQAVDNWSPPERWERYPEED